MAVGDLMPSFIWGEGGRALTPEEVERERELAMALQEGAIDTSPVGHWTQGAARIVQALAGNLREGRANRAAGENAAYNERLLSALLGGGGTSSGATAAIPAPEAAAELAATDPSTGGEQFGAVAPRLIADLARDFNLTPENAAGIVGQLGHESAGFGTLQEVNPMVEGSRGGYGYAQWTGPRRRAYEAYAAENGLDPSSYEANYGFLRHELQNTPESRVVAALQSAPNAQAAGRIFTDQFLRPGIPGYESRDRWTQRALGAIGNQPAPVEVAGGGGRMGDYGELNPAIVRAMTDPRATPQTQRIAAMLYEQQVGAQQRAAERQAEMNDPARLLDFDTKRLQNEKLRRDLNTQGFDGVTVGNRIVDRRTGEVVYEAPEQTQQFRRATPEEAAQYGAQAGQFGPDGRFYPNNPPSGTSLQVDPATGAVQFNQGPGVAKPLTEVQSKDVLYATRATNAMPTIDKYENELLSLGGSLAEGIPLNLGNYAQSENYQLARDAGRDFLATILRKDTGAAITANEEQIYGKMFLPQPGDKPATVAAKRQRRALAVEAIKAGMPLSAIENMTKALDNVPGAAGGGEPPPQQKQRLKFNPATGELE